MAVRRERMVGGDDDEAGTGASQRRIDAGDDLVGAIVGTVRARVDGLRRILEPPLGVEQYEPQARPGIDRVRARTASGRAHADVLQPETLDVHPLAFPAGPTIVRVI